MIKETYNEINKGASSGYGKDWLKVDKDGLPNPVVIKMQQNIYKFSGAKTYTQLQELNSALTKNGKILSWNDFKTEALKINGKYNINYLQAEYQTAKQAGYHANNWETFQDNKKRYPNLKYRTQQDDRVREEHQALEGLIVPIDHPFWLSFYPPNGWRCRCFVEQTKENADLSTIPETVPNVKDEFKINTGISGQVFSEDNLTPHNYFALARDQDSKALRNAFEIAKDQAPVNIIHEGKKGARVLQNIFFDKSKAIGDIRVAKKIVDYLNIDVFIQALIDLNKRKNPEYKILDLLADRKEINSAVSGVHNAINSIRSQIESKRILVIDFFNIKSVTVEDIKSQLTNNIFDKDGVPFRGKNIIKVIFVKETAVMLDRADIVKEKFEDLEKFINENYPK